MLLPSARNTRPHLLKTTDTCGHARYEFRFCERGFEDQGFEATSLAEVRAQLEAALALVAAQERLEARNDVALPATITVDGGS